MQDAELGYEEVYFPNAANMPMLKVMNIMFLRNTTPADPTSHNDITSPDVIILQKFAQ